MYWLREYAAPSTIWHIALSSDIAWVWDSILVCIQASEKHFCTCLALCSCNEKVSASECQEGLQVYHCQCQRQMLKDCSSTACSRKKKDKWMCVTFLLCLLWRGISRLVHHSVWQTCLYLCTFIFHLIIPEIERCLHWLHCFAKEHFSTPNYSYGFTCAIHGQIWSIAMFYIRYYMAKW